MHGLQRWSCVELLSLLYPSTPATHTIHSWATWLWVCLIGTESVGYRHRSRRLFAASCAFQRLMGSWTCVGNYCYAELLIIYSGVFTLVLCTTKQSMMVALWTAWGDPTVMDLGWGPGGWCRLGETPATGSLLRSNMCSTSRRVCSHCNLFTLTVAAGYGVAVQLIVVGVHAAEGPKVYLSGCATGHSFWKSDFKWDVLLNQISWQKKYMAMYHWCYFKLLQCQLTSQTNDYWLLYCRKSLLMWTFLNLVKPDTWTYETTVKNVNHFF